MLPKWVSALAISFVVFQSQLFAETPKRKTLDIEALKGLGCKVYHPGAIQGSVVKPDDAKAAKELLVELYNNTKCKVMNPIPGVKPSYELSFKDDKRDFFITISDGPVVEVAWRGNPRVSFLASDKVLMRIKEVLKSYKVEFAIIAN